MATSIKLDDSTRERVRHIAELRDRSPHWIMRKAIDEYLEREEKRETFRQEALASMREYRESGRHITLSETSDWLSKWGTDEDSAAPACHQ